MLRRVKPSSPVTVEYELTQLGHSLVPVLVELTDWAVAAMPEIEVARSRFGSSGSVS